MFLKHLDWDLDTPEWSLEPCQGILKRELSLYCWPPVWLVWNQLYDNWQFLFLFAKQTNPNQSNRRPKVQWYLPLKYSLTLPSPSHCIETYTMPVVVPCWQIGWMLDPRSQDQGFSSPQCPWSWDRGSSILPLYHWAWPPARLRSRHSEKAIAGSGNTKGGSITVTVTSPWKRKKSRHALKISFIRC